MAYNPATDGVGLWRNNGASYLKETMPGIDFVVAALGRAGLITVTVAATQPLVNQNVTAWFQPAAPSYSGEGALYLWDPDTTAYAPATMALLLHMLQAAAGQNGVSWYTTAGGPPANTVGNNGDFAIRMDFPGGIYGPKVTGAWPVSAIPGTTYAVDSTALDASFGDAPGSLIFRAAVTWQALLAGANGYVLAMRNTGLPNWIPPTTLLDDLGNQQGEILFRNAANWGALVPGTPGYILATQGPGANPAWVVPGAEFVSGTVMVFRQTAAPTNWTKQTAINDAGLRVTNGAIGSGGSVGFNTLFATTAVGNTTLSQAQTPSHFHTVSPQAILGGTTGGGGVGGGGTFGLQGAQVTDTIGGNGTHTHALDLRLSYVDIIIATKN